MCDDNECAPIKPSPITPEPLPNPDKKDAIVVNELPEKGEPNAVYWLMKEGSDAYDLYQWVNDDWRKIDIDISLYGSTGNNTDGAMTQKATTDALATKADKSEIKTYTGGKRITVNQDNSIDADGLVILSYGNSTWQDFLDAYNDNAIVYCKASSETNPALGSQGRLAFMAFITNPTNPTAVEFQYFRSVTKKDATQQCDQIYVYKLTSANKWTVEIRNVASKIVAGTGLSSTYDNGEITLNATGGGQGSTVLYVNSADIVNGRTMAFYSDANFSSTVSIGDVHSLLSSGADVKITVKDATEGTFSGRQTYNVYHSSYPIECTDETMDEVGMILNIIGAYGQNTKMSIRFQSFAGPTYDEFTVGIESF